MADDPTVKKHYIQPESVEVNFRVWDKHDGGRDTNGRFIARVDYYPEPDMTFIRRLDSQCDKEGHVVSAPLRPHELRLLADAIEETGKRVRAADIIQRYPWYEGEEEEE